MARVGVGEVGTQPAGIRPSTSRTDQIIIMEVPWQGDPASDFYSDNPDRAIDGDPRPNYEPGPADNEQGGINPNKLSSSAISSATTGHGEHHKRQLLIAEASLRQGGETIDVPYKTGNAGATRAALGPTDLQEGLMIIGSCDGTELLWRMMTQDLNPEWYRIGYEDYTIYTDLDVSSADDSDTNASNNFTTNHFPGRVKVTLGSGFALSDVAVPGTITINGTDSDGNTGASEIIEVDQDAIEAGRTLATDTYYYAVGNVAWDSGFDTGALVDVHVDLTQEYNAPIDIAQITITGDELFESVSYASPGSGTFDEIPDEGNGLSNPVELNVIFGINSNLIIGRIGVIVISGTDKDGLAIEEIMRFRDDQVFPGASRKSRNFFSSIDVGGINIDGFSSGTVSISIQDRASRVTFQPQDEVLAIFWLIELTKGITPNMYDGVIVNQLTASIARDTAMEFAATILGRKGAERRNLKGETGKAARRSDISLLEHASTTVFTGWQCEVSVNGWISPLLGATLTINQQLANADVITGDRHQESPPIPGPDRDCMVEGNIVYAPENNMSQWYLDNEVLPDVNVIFRNNTKGSFDCVTKIEYNECYISQNPDPASPREGRVEQAFSVMSFVDEIGGPPTDYRIVCDFPDYEPVRDFSAAA